MDSQREGSRLTDALRAVAADDGALSASPSVEQQLLAEVRSVARRRRRRAALSTIGAAAVLAVAAAASWTMSRATPSRATAPPVNQSSVRSGAAVLQATPFLPLPYSGVPMSEGAQLVRLEVPRSALVSFGLAPVDGAPAGASETVFADVLVGEDGLARAVRFVQP
jgi:predicted permease